MKRTTKKRFKWLLSDKPAKLRKRIEEIREEFINMILQMHKDELTGNY